MESFAHFFVTSLVETFNFEVEIFAVQWSEFPVPYTPYPELLQEYWITARSDENVERHEKNIIRDVDMRYAVRTLAESCDVIFNHSQSGVPIQLQDQISVPVITPFHAWMSPNHKIAVLEQVANWVTTSWFVWISEDNAQPRNALDLPISMKVIRNGVNLSTRNYYDTPSQDEYYVRAWRIDPQKWTSEVVKIAKKLWIKLKIAWHIYYEDYYTNEVLPYLDDNIEYVWELTTRELNSLIWNAHAFLFTALWKEPFGLVLVEALASWTPVIAYNSWASERIIEPSVGVVVDQKDHDWFIAGIRNAKKFNRAECRKYVEEHYSRDSTMKQYVEYWYERIKNMNT